MDAITRRELLSKSTALLLLVPVAACSGSSAPPAGSQCTGPFETSTVTNGHTHTLCVPLSDLTNPPAAGVTYTTSTDVNHNHTVALTQQQLQTINAGTAVTVTTSSPLAHNFTIQKT
jgi:hypothetical protein